MEIRTIEMWTKIELGHVGINFEEKIGWAKIGSSKQAHHVKINSFKHFTGPKKGPRVELQFLSKIFRAFFMKLRLFYRGEKEYRQKRKAIKRHDSDGETESEPEEKKVERRKKKFRLGLHEDQSFVDSPDAIYMWQFEATHPYTWLSGEYSLSAVDFRTCTNRSEI